MKNRKVEINKGEIKDNALKAMLLSNLYKHKVEKKLKGKGSYTRKAKHRNSDVFYLHYGKPCDTLSLLIK
jgi:domain of unknown function